MIAVMNCPHCRAETWMLKPGEPCAVCGHGLGGPSPLEQQRVTEPDRDTPVCWCGTHMQGTTVNLSGQRVMQWHCPDWRSHEGE